jgi:NAD(P)-dependent dehydrogenase (short-subunit alcohol dehydrogenase family)
MSNELEGRVALITGAARGIGAAAARQMAREGATVVLTDVVDDEGAAVAAELQAAGHAASYHRLDVADEDAWTRVVGDVVREHGRLDILVNNAGIGTFTDVESETLDGWNRLIAINQTGVWLGMRAVIPAMRAHGGGSIINLSSIFGAVGGFGGSIAYHASKGAVRLMTKNAAIRYAKEGIRVNSVHPGFIDTPMVASVKGTDIEKVILADTPMGRLGASAEVAEVIGFLASDRSSYMTGSEVYVDGGWTAR